MNRKVLRRQIESDSTGIWQNAVVKEADDGLTAVEAMRTEMAAEECFDFVLLDFVMVQPVCMYYISLIYNSYFWLIICSVKCMVQLPPS